MPKTTEETKTSPTKVECHLTKNFKPKRSDFSSRNNFTKSKFSSYMNNASAISNDKRYQVKVPNKNDRSDSEQNLSSQNGDEKLIWIQILNQPFVSHSIN